MPDDPDPQTREAAERYYRERAARLLADYERDTGRRARTMEELIAWHEARAARRS